MIEKAVSEFYQSQCFDIGLLPGRGPNGRGDAGGSPPSRTFRAEAVPAPAALAIEPPAGHTSLSSGMLSSTGEPPWHAIRSEAVVASLEGSAEAGLSSEAVRERLAAYGPNSLPEPPRRSKFEIFFSQMNSLPVALLGVAAGISILTGAIADAIVIMAVVAINSSVGYVTESEADRTISSLKTLMHPSAMVIREGARKRIDARDLVPGDLMILEPGTYISADCRLIEAERLLIDESSLTGESHPALKETGLIEDVDIALADRKNIIYMGTLVTGGQGCGIVIATGRSTEIGKLQAMIGETVSPETPLEKQLNTIGNQLVLLCGSICGLVFIVGVVRGAAIALIAKTTISLAVAAVPEGLPAVATTTLALGIRKMNAHRVIIRNLEAVETLGEVQTICFDKTGTVTENRMSVIRIFSGNQMIELKQDGFFRGARKISPRRNHLLQLARICILCAEVSEEDAAQGSSTEKALLEFAIRAGLNISEENDRHPRIKTTFRTEDRHFMYTIHTVNGGQDDAPETFRFLALKGNPVEVLAMCDKQLVGQQTLPLGAQDISKIEIENERMAGEALRVLGFAFKTGEDEEDLESLSGLTWLGLARHGGPFASRNE